MAKNERRWKGPKVPPIQKIELSTNNILLRAIGVGVLLLVAGLAFGYALNSMLRVEPGWQEVESSASTVHCGGDFSFQYDFTDYGGNASASYKALEKLYSQLTEDAYRIFLSEEGTGNLAELNANPGKTVTVDPALYDALRKVEESGSRYLYLAPVYVEYNRIFLCETDAEAALNDPAQNPELVPYIQAAAAFANDPSMVHLELMADNQVRLHIAQAYSDFASEYGIEKFLDFGWMANAFIIDYMADVLAENDFIYGHISSYDGFTRNLDNRGSSYSFNIFDRVDNDIYLPAVMRYSQPLSIVFLRNYPMSDRDRWHYFGFENGTIATAFIDPADGMSKSAIDSLVSYSGEAGCAEIALQMAPAFLADAFDPGIIAEMEQNGIYSAWCQDNTLYCNDAQAQLDMQTDETGITYSKRIGSAIAN